MVHEGMVQLLAMRMAVIVVASAVLASACASRATFAGRVGAAAAYCHTTPKICN